MPVTTLNTDLLTASLGRSIPLAYGKHIVGGNVILKDETEEDHSIVFLALGDASGGALGAGEWDGIEKLWINGVEADIALAPADFHFHRGLAGQLSSNGTLDPEGIGAAYPFTEDGDQKADGFTPPGVQGLTFSRTAYLALNVPFDPFAPAPDLSVFGIFRTRRVRVFDAFGVQIDYRYEENPAWQIADLLTVVRGLSDSRIDWASFVAAADYCDALIDPLNDGNTVKRFVSNVAFTEEVDFDAALAALLSPCRGVLLDTDGTIKLRVDQARASVFDFQDHDTAGAKANILDGAFETWWKDTREVANRLELLFRDVDNDFAVMTKFWNHEPQQAQTGRVIPAKVHLGNLPQHQAERLGNYLLTRAIDNNLFCRFRSDPSSFKVMPGDVVRVKHDAAPWSQAAAGSGLYETFEVLECSDNPDETRDFLCQLYRAATYTDTAGPAQNLVGTTVRRRPSPPPIPTDWSLAVIPRGHLWLDIKIPQNADYRAGNVIVLADLELERVETTLTSPLGAADTEAEVASSAGFLVGDYVNIGEEILKIMGPGVNEAPPASNTWEIARAQKLSEAGAAASGASVYRLTERHLHFAFPPGFTLARAGKTHTVDLRPGRMRILHAALQLIGLGGATELGDEFQVLPRRVPRVGGPLSHSTPDPRLELPFWANWEQPGYIEGSLPGLRVAAGGAGMIQVPGPLAVGADLAMPLVLPEDVSITWAYAEFRAEHPTLIAKVQLKLNGEDFGPETQIQHFTGIGPTYWVLVSGAKKGNVGGKEVALEITEVTSGGDLSVVVLV